MAPSPLSDKAKKILDENILSESEIENILLFGHGEHTQSTSEVTFNEGATEYKIVSLSTAKRLIPKI